MTSSVKPVAVMYQFWKNAIWTTHQGQRVEFSRISEAREWAKKLGRPIRVFPV